MSKAPRWTFLPAAAVLAAIALIGGSATAAEITKVKSTVIIKSGEGAEFTGKVRAAQKKCRAGRLVKLFRESDSGGPDQLVGVARTDATGAWDIGGSFMAGRYHAEVMRSFAHAGDDLFNCLPAVGLSARF
jgi:hypothetical protein